jgi:hypothetical protein
MIGKLKPENPKQLKKRKAKNDHGAKKPIFLTCKRDLYIKGYAGTIMKHILLFGLNPTFGISVVNKNLNHT